MSSLKGVGLPQEEPEEAEDLDEPGKVSSLRALRAHQEKQSLLSASMFLRKVKYSYKDSACKCHEPSVSLPG